VPLSDRVCAELRERRGIGSALVFASATGGHLDPGNLHGRILKPAARAAGVGWVGFHSLRHTAGSRWFARGWNVLQVSATLGHSDAAFTARTYLHDVSGELPASPFTDQATATP
jgi:integrase